MELPPWSNEAYFEIREWSGCPWPYCLICSKFADEDHVASAKHLKRVPYYLDYLPQEHRARIFATSASQSAPLPAAPGATQPAAAACYPTAPPIATPYVSLGNHFIGREDLPPLPANEQPPPPLPPFKPQCLSAAPPSVLPEAATADVSGHSKQDGDSNQVEAAHDGWKEWKGRDWGDNGAWGQNDAARGEPKSGAGEWGKNDASDWGEGWVGDGARGGRADAPRREEDGAKRESADAKSATPGAAAGENAEAAESGAAGSTNDWAKDWAKGEASKWASSSANDWTKREAGESATDASATWASGGSNNGWQHRGNDWAACDNAGWSHGGGWKQNSTGGWEGRDSSGWQNWEGAESKDSSTDWKTSVAQEWRSDWEWKAGEWKW